MTKYVTTGTGQKHLHSRRNCPNLVGAEDVNIREASGQEERIRDKCRMCHHEIVTCEHCGEEYTIQGIASHKKFCEENPDRLGAKVPVLD